MADPVSLGGVGQHPTYCSELTVISHQGNLLLAKLD